MVWTLALTQALQAEDDVTSSGQPGLFDRLDSNGDGQIAAAEVSGDQTRLFRRLVRGGDKNNDGRLSRDEFAQAIESPRPRRPLEEKQPSEIPGSEALKRLIGEMDANGDGKIVAEEVPERLQATAKRMLDVADANKDGTLARREINRASPRLARLVAQRDRPQGRGPDSRGARGPGRRGPGNTDRRGPGNSDRRRPGDSDRRRPGASDRRGPGGPPMGRPPAPGMRLMRILDTDGDGALSNDEIAAASAALAKLDTNGDGKVSRNELMPRRRQGGPGQRPGARQRGPGQGQPGQGQRGRAGQGQRRRGQPGQGQQGQGQRRRGQPGQGQPGQGQRRRGQDRPGQDRPGQGGARQFDPERFVERTMAADKDGDGKISKREAPERLQRRFDRLDANGDGQLTREELREGAANQRRRSRDRQTN